MRSFASRFTQLYPSPRQACVRQGSRLHDWSLKHRALHSTSGLDTLGPPSQSADTTPLQKIILGSIQARGPLSVAQYMQMCLSHPTEGYYMKGDPIGARGDFITSPEISQVFGELVGIWLVSQWLEHGKGRPIRMIELGPGRGTLMDDVLRTFNSIGQTRGRVQTVHLVETSARLQEEQQTKLAGRVEKDALHWNDRLEDIPQRSDAFTMVVAHELFDAIPIHIIEKATQGFQEVLVDIDRAAQTTATASPLVSTASKPQSSGLRYVLSGRLSPLANTLGLSSPRFAKLPVGSRIEVSPASWGIARTMGELINAPGGGTGLVIDYGDDRAFGSSFRAFQKHKIVDVFHQPGMCDLTANVDFAYLKEAIATAGATSHGIITQQVFLAGMGASVRLQKLLDGTNDIERRALLEKGAQRLMDPLGMGTQYKVLGITSNPGSAYPFSAL
ncbi:DUF185-domain-containing protein [Ceratobasidium sp. AG-I]|nr:DUF185-domain-containing protein [Ceratobasidium sp. AG-I]